MAGFKYDRMAQDVHRELSDILRSLKDPRISDMLSIVRIDLSHDGSHCKVYVSSMLGAEDTRSSVAGLRSASNYVRRELFARLKMRKSPELEFIADNSIERGTEISKKISQIRYTAETEEEDGTL